MTRLIGDPPSGRDHVLDQALGDAAPPSDGTSVGVGQYIAGTGAALPGGPGPAFHFLNGFAPGASFCTASKSPGLHF